MLEWVDIIVDIKNSDLPTFELIQNFVKSNYDSIEFTIHVENGNLRLKLINSNQNSLYDGTLAIEQFLHSVERVLERKNLNFSIIQHLNTSSPPLGYSSEDN